MSKINASIITIGDELLIGQTIDTNSAWIAQRLNEIGIDVIRRVAVGDLWPAIVEALGAEIQAAHIILITGGLGPTADDITKPLLAEYFGGTMVINDTVAAHVAGIFERRKLPMLERNRKQAEVPDNCEVLFNSRGTAPGMLFRKDNKIIISMPGVPSEMKGIMQDHVLPMLRQAAGDEAVVHSTIITSGLGESFVSERIEDLESALPPHIKLAYLPNNWVLKLRLTGKGKDRWALQQEVLQYMDELAARLDDIIVAREDIPLEQVLHQQLSGTGKTVALAESCTGGDIGNRITRVPGASAYFRGGVICYQTIVKQHLLHVPAALLEQEGEVSAAVAEAIAKGARALLDTDFGFGITGVLGPAGLDDVPVGTVWIGICDRHGSKSVQYHFPYDRLKNKEIATDMGLLQLWKFIKERL